jgi:hypothetical protein
MAKPEFSVSMRMTNREGATPNEVAWEISSAITQILFDDADTVQILEAVQQNLSVSIDALKNQTLNRSLLK